MRIKIPIEIIELEPGNFHLMVQSVFQEGNSVNWIIDTGASKTVFDKNNEEYYTEMNDESDEIHSVGVYQNPIDVSIAILHIHQFGKLKVKAQKVALLDLSHINVLYSKVINRKIGGLLGGDFLMKYKALINYKKKILTLET